MTGDPFPARHRGRGRPGQPGRLGPRGRRVPATSTASSSVTSGSSGAPRALDEAEAGLLGDVEGRRVLEIGCGAGAVLPLAGDPGRGGGRRRPLVPAAPAQPADRRRDRDRGPRRLRHGHLAPDRGRRRSTSSARPSAPFRSSSTSTWRCARSPGCCVPGGRLVFSVVHPARWMFPDDPSAAGLTVVRSYFDRTPYVETDEAGRPSYVEPHHTLEDWTRASSRRPAWTSYDLHEPSGQRVTTGCGGPGDRCAERSSPAR